MTEPNVEAGGEKRRQIAERIARALRSDNIIMRDDTAQNIADLDWISDRYRQLRMVHTGGFQGAQRAVHAEFVEMVLREAL